MPNDTLAANAASMPRRLFLSAGPAAAVFATLHGAKAVTAAAAALPSHPDAALFALQPLIDVADREYDETFDAVAVADGKMFARPKKPADPELDQLSRQAIAEFGKRMAKIRALGPTPEQVAYEEAVRQWEQEEALAHLESGRDAAHEAQRAKHSGVMALQTRIVETRATTLAGLIFKARYAVAHYGGEPDQDVIDSIVDDLLAMAGEA
jgi:hypothetical protein